MSETPKRIYYSSAGVVSDDSNLGKAFRDIDTSRSHTPYIRADTLRELVEAWEKWHARNESGYQYAGQVQRCIDDLGAAIEGR